MEKEFKRTQRVKLKEINALSKKYISDNEEEVKSSNQRMIVAISTIYLVVIIAYNLIVPIFFSDWGVSIVYQVALGVHVPILLFIMLRYWRKNNRSLREIQIFSVIFQLYIMAFVVIISVVPFWKEQPAVYFAPIAIGFTMLLMYTFNVAVLLSLIETIVIIVVSFLTKSSEIVNVNMFNAVLTFVVAFYVIYMLYSNRINESRQRKMLRKMGQTDKLTQIYNRAATEMLSQEYIQSHKDANFALMIIDIDEFKSVNDTYGHQTGDMVISTVAHIIEDAAGPDNIAGRMGGDEFMVFIRNFNSRDDIKKIAADILRGAIAIKMPDDRVRVSCSIGVCALKGSEWMEYDDMFKCADRALYYIKEHGKNCCAFYSKDADK